MQTLVKSRELLIEAGIEYNDELKPEQRLNARQHHAAFIEDKLHRFGQRQLFLFYVLGLCLIRHANAAAGDCLR